ncbi:MAG: porin [Gemmatimonadetes bacterium]|nr:porin [Gemmatimonadota bacterium]
MKRSALLFGALLFGAASGANAQALTMQMSNGWTFGFAGNVNIFAMYQSVSSSNNATGSPGQLVTGADLKGLYYGTGLLPSFATFTAKGKEGNTDLGVQFGFAPQVQCGGNQHDCFGTGGAGGTSVGAQIDMRQVFMTVGGSWGTITAGKELGVYQRSNILNDQTLFGVGGGGIAPGGTTLGRIGFGYIYTNFVPQFTYSSPAGRTTSFNIGLMEPSAFGAYNELTIPRIEAEVSFKAGSNLTVFVGGTAQPGKDPVADQSKTAIGGSGGLTYKSSTFSVHGSGYFGKGLGTTLMFSGLSHDGAGELSTSYGYFGQLTFTPAASKATFAGSFGSSFLKDDGDNFKTENSLISGGIYYQATKSLKIVGEGDYMWSKDKDGSGKNKAFTGAFGMMLFY